MLRRNFIFIEETDSTNTRLKEKVRRSAGPVFDVLSAARQTGGRGRQGKSFYSPAGGVYFSAAYPLTGDETNLPFFTLLSGLAAAEALQETCNIRALIKWPNDLYFHGKKLAGILTELVPSGGGNTAVVGVGLNASLQKREIPAELAHIMTSLAAEGIPSPAPESFIKAFVARLDRYVYETPALRGGGAPYAAKINERAYLNGKRVTVNFSDHTLRGTVTGVLPNGSLSLQTERGQENVTGGVVGIIEEIKN